jgi:uncharacterized protein (TIGR02147 family)
MYKMDKNVRTVDKSETKIKKTSAQPLYITLLQNELARRSRLNPQYSLRSFAKQIGMDASLLSKVLKNQRKLTLENAKKIIKRCQMNPADKKLFWSSLVQEREKLHTLYDEKSDELATRSNQFQESLLPNDLFQLIADPQHYVLAELARTQGFVSDVAWISKRLKLSRAETADTLGRLLRVGILTKNGDQIKRNPARFTTENKELTNSALKHHQRKILESAITAMDQVPIEKRSQNSMTIAINPKKIPLAKELIQTFVNQLSNLLESGPLEEVYQISVSLFPNDQSEKTK